MKEEYREESEVKDKEIKKAKSVQGRKNISKAGKEKEKGNLDAFFKKKS